MTAAPRQMRLAAHFPVDDTVPSDPRSGSRIAFSSFEHLARTAERGLFDFLLLADALPPRERGGPGRDPDAGRPEPLTVLAALAAVTDRIGLAATVSATFNEPYEVARRFATLDHLSAGRAAWNVATAADARIAENFRRGGRLDRESEHARTAEFIATARELWDSWSPGGDPRPFAHHGRHFSVEGEFTVPRSPQGHPVVIRTGHCAQARESAASDADVVLTRHGTPEAGRAFRADVRGRLAAYGREPGALTVMPRAGVVLGDTDAEARERAAALRREPARGSDVSLRQTVTGATACQSFVGAPRTVAAEMAHRVATGAADGFVIVPHPTSGGLDGFVDRVVPLLQERGVFRTAYTGSTLRSHLGLAEPVWKG
ncbi:LLM class flavin-dependent oxidoreductase [Streptomyces sp. NPDC001743]|uniref:LLM class flavin-dependent oxidoreductase n=1 Tax=Streptomyces sp. NPDC001743 TaxID=3154397 RepID=UPI0033202E79